MTRSRAVPSRKRKPARRRRRRLSIARWMPTTQQRKRWRRRVNAWPLPLKIGAGVAAALVLWLAANWVYQVFRKPSELFFPVSVALHKVPSDTWREYGAIFRRHSTATMSPTLLAALAQIEASGNPVARTYWRFTPALHPFEIYRPASSAVGMYQITDATFDVARRFCIRNHRVVTDGPWYDWRSCWFNGLYTRTIPSHAVELTAAYLDRQVAVTLARHHIVNATLADRQRLAALIHLCGAGTGERYARRGLKLTPGQRCGDHDARSYLDRVAAMQRTFARLAETAPQ
jgi:hypothetical protein